MLSADPLSSDGSKAYLDNVATLATFVSVSEPPSVAGKPSDFASGYVHQEAHKIVILSNTYYTEAAISLALNSGGDR